MAYVAGNVRGPFLHAFTTILKYVLIDVFATIYCTLPVAYMPCILIHYVKNAIYIAKPICMAYTYLTLFTRIHVTIEIYTNSCICYHILYVARHVNL